MRQVKGGVGLKCLSYIIPAFRDSVIDFETTS